jgi:hypothetical protein
MSVAHAPVSFTLFSQSDWLSAWARRDQNLGLSLGSLDSSSQFLHVFILVPKSRFDLTIRMTSTSRPSRVSPVKSFIDRCD